MKIPSVASVLRRELFSFVSLFWTTLIAFLYLCTLTFLLNYRFSFYILRGSGSFLQKLSLFSSLLLGFLTAFSSTDTVITIASALLVGVNIFLIFRTIDTLQNQNHIKLSIGGVTLIGFVATGCSSCGLTLLSLIGLGSAFSFLPFRGMEIHILSLVFLIFSAWYMLKKLRDSLYCEVK